MRPAPGPPRARAAREVGRHGLTRGRRFVGIAGAGLVLLLLTLGRAGPSAASPAAAQEAPTTLQDARADSILSLLRELRDDQDSLEVRIDSLSARLDDGAGGDEEIAEGPGGTGQMVGEAGERVRSFGLGIFWSFLLVLVFNYLIRGLVWALDSLAERQPARRLFYKRLVPILRIVLWSFVVYLVVRVVFRVDTQGIVAGAAAIGVAIGLAAQDLLKNLFGGLILIFDQPFQVGDKVSVGGTYGEVVSIGLRSTRLVTADDNLVSIPNAHMVDGQVANANAGQLNCQVVTDLHLPGFVDEAVAKKIAFQAASTSKYVFLNKPIVVLVQDDFRETFLTRIRIKAYVLDPRYEFLFQSDVTERARSGFREAGLFTRADGMRAWVSLGDRPPGEESAGSGPPRDGEAAPAPEGDA